MFVGSIPKKIRSRLNKHLTVPKWDRYDDIRATAWHDATGFTIEEWQERIELYALDRGRDVYFGVNEDERPVAIFDCKTLKEYHEKIKHERFLQEKNYDEIVKAKRTQQ